MLKKSALLVLSLLLCAGMVFASGSQEDTGADGKKIIGYVPQSSFAGETSLAYFKGTQDAVEALGYEFVVIDPNFDGTKQLQIIENLIAQKVAGIVVHPIDSTLVAAGIKKANAAGIPVVSNVSDVAGGDVKFTVTMDLNSVGSLSAQAMVDRLIEKYGEPKGTVISIGGPLTCMVSNGRGEGMNSVFDKYPGIEVIHRPADWNIYKAEEALRDLLTVHPEADGLISYTDFYNDGLIGALKALDRYKKAGEEGHLIWTSVDGMPDGLARIKEGYMDATADSACETYGKYSVKYLDAAINGEEIPAVGGSVVEEGAAWSPAKVIAGPSGPVMQLKSFLIDSKTVNNSNLWGNNSYEVKDGRVVYSN